MRASYWTCSKFAKWLRSLVGVKSPSSATANGWKTWRDDYKTMHPIMYYITEIFLQTAQNIAYKPIDIIDNIGIYIRNRFISKIHYLPTNLKVGKYHEFDQRILHGLFETLVDFVEVDKMYHYCAWNNVKKPKSKLFCCHRSRELGMKSIAWEMELIEDDGTPTLQAIHARELHDLYVWWKDIRPARLDPMIASGYYDESTEGEDVMDILARPSSPSRLKAGQLMHEIEESYNQEDEDMMIRLIKLRQSMWT